MTNREIKILEAFLDYLQDKVESCYKEETQQEIDEFLKLVKR